MISGTLLVTVNLLPGEWMQRNDILGKAGIDYAPLAYAVMEVNKTGATVWAYATVIDNATGDPTGLPLMMGHMAGKDLLLMC